MAKDDQPDSTATLAPHPHLTRYYKDDGEKRTFIRGIFDRTAVHYDRVEKMMAFGTGSWYRRQALLRAGLQAGLSVLDVAIGTGLVARQAVNVVGDPRLVLGLDPSEGMLREARRMMSVPVILGTAEQLPVAADSIDFVSMGYALRHLADLLVVFREFHRVLKPGGRICILEITRPEGRIAYTLLRSYMKWIVPTLTRVTTRHADTQLLWRYYWESIEVCVPPARVLDALAQAGFANVRRHVELGIFSEYTGQKSS